MNGSKHITLTNTLKTNIKSGKIPYGSTVNSNTQEAIAEIADSITNTINKTSEKLSTVGDKAESVVTYLTGYK